MTLKKHWVEEKEKNPSLEIAILTCQNWEGQTEEHGGKKILNFSDDHRNTA